MKKALDIVKVSLFAFALIAMAVAMYPAPSQADIVCWDTGHACHVCTSDGCAHHGKFQEIQQK